MYYRRDFRALDGQTTVPGLHSVNSVAQRMAQGVSTAPGQPTMGPGTSASGTSGEPQALSGTSMGTLTLDQLQTLILQVQQGSLNPNRQPFSGTATGVPHPAVIQSASNFVQAPAPLDLSGPSTRSRSRSPKAKQGESSQRNTRRLSRSASGRRSPNVGFDVSDDSDGESEHARLNLDAQSMRHPTNRQQMQFNKKLHSQLRRTLDYSMNSKARKAIESCLTEIEKRCTEIQVADTYGLEVAKQLRAGSELHMPAEDQNRLNQIVLAQFLAQSAQTLRAPQPAIQPQPFRGMGSYLGPRGYFVFGGFMPGFRPQRGTYINQGQANGGFTRRQPGPNELCNHCKKPGHFWRFCPERPAHVTYTNTGAPAVPGVPDSSGSFQQPAIQG